MKASRLWIGFVALVLAGCSPTTNLLIAPHAQPVEIHPSNRRRILRLERVDQIHHAGADDGLQLFCRQPEPPHRPQPRPESASDPGPPGGGNGRRWHFGARDRTRPPPNRFCGWSRPGRECGRMPPAECLPPHRVTRHGGYEPRRCRATVRRTLIQVPDYSHPQPQVQSPQGHSSVPVQLQVQPASGQQSCSFEVLLVVLMSSHVNNCLHTC